MLGDMEPDTLQVIASGRDVAASKTKTVMAGDRAIGVDTVLHALDQEIRRVSYFRDHAPTEGGKKGVESLVKLDTKDRIKEAKKGASNEEEQEKAVQSIEDSKWDVRLVTLALSDDSSIVLTYGEMNTLADIYGSPDELHKTPATNLRHVVAGVREESVRKLMRLRNEIGGDQHYDPDADKHGFAGAIGNVGKGDTAGELSLMGTFGGGKQTVKGSPETSYSAGLARNACHFAPQSWHAWAGYHEQALELAKSAHALNEKGESEAGEAKANDALIHNGFGDHFLQDSFAAGHLINKTLIMQWFVKWLDDHTFKSKQTTDENWRKAQNMAYAQPGLAGRDLYDAPIGGTKATDPQTAENTEGDVTDRFKAAGLSIPSWMKDPNSDEFKVFTWWQKAAFLNPGISNIQDIDELKKSPVKDEQRLVRVLTRLHADTVIHYENYSSSDMEQGVGKIGVGSWIRKNFQLRDEFVPKDRKSFSTALSNASKGDTSTYERMATVTMKGDYSTFLNNSYLQLATNVLHDDFCKNGLIVRPEVGSESFKVYGDNAMLQAGSAEGVVWSSKTARASRDSIYETIKDGEPGDGHTTTEIGQRIPKKVTPVKNGGELSLEAWHGEGGELWKYCNEKSFPEAAAFFSKGTVVGLTNLAPVISKDDAHKSEGF